MIRDTKILNNCTCVQIPVASVDLDQSSPFAIASRVAKTELNVLQTASTANYLQDQSVSESLCNHLSGLSGCNDCFRRKTAWVKLRDKKFTESPPERRNQMLQRHLVYSLLEPN